MLLPAGRRLRQGQGRRPISSMMRTLHLYLARELLKAFGLTAIALTLLVVLGGGVANIFKGEGIGAMDVLKVFAFLTPVAITLILPVAALFSAAITYGRSAADNEITACRAAGINIHRLLLSAGLLGLLVTIITYWAWNYMIPGLSRQIEEITRRDLPGIVVQQFQRAKPLIFGRHRIMASRCELVDPSRMASDRPQDHTYLLLTGVSFVEMEDEEIMRYGTADATVIDFHRSEGLPRVSADLQGVHVYDAARGQYYDLAHQSLPPIEIPLPMKRKTKFEDLGSLLTYLQHPEESPEVVGWLYGIKKEMMTLYLYQYVIEGLQSDGYFRLSGPGVSYEIHSKEGSRDPDDGRPIMRVIRVVEKGPEGTFIYTADTATIEVRSTFDRERPVILIELIDNVEVSKQGAPAGEERSVRKPKESLKPIQYMDQELLRRQAEAFDTRGLLRGETIPGLPRKQERQVEKFQEFALAYRAEVNGEIHFRASYALTSIAVVVMGAVLGIIVRGGQVLTAFGISCIPSLFVVLCSIVGRNLADKPEYAFVSLGVMWGGTAMIYLATGFITLRFLKQ